MGLDVCIHRAGSNIQLKDTRLVGITKLQLLPASACFLLFASFSTSRARAEQNIYGQTLDTV